MVLYTAEYNSFIERPGEAAGRRIKLEKYVSGTETYFSGKLLCYFA